MTSAGPITKPNGNPLFKVSDTTNVINQKTKAKEAIDDVLKMTDGQCFKQFKPEEITK